eukprot:scaffold11144_cov111-Isochrysis_galbana.AAC.7
MGDPSLYPEIRTARFIYAMQRLPRDFTADVQARQQWVDNNLTYLDGLVLADLHYHDADFRRGTWVLSGARGAPRLKRTCLSWMVSLIVIASLAGSQSMNLAAEGAGDIVLAGTICCVQKEVVVSAIGVGKVSGSQGINL